MLFDIRLKVEFFKCEMTKIIRIPKKTLSVKLQTKAQFSSVEINTATKPGTNTMKYSENSFAMWFNCDETNNAIKFFIYGT